MSKNLPPNEDRMLNEMNKGDLTEAIRFGSWFSNLWATTISSFIGCSIKRIFSLRKTYSGEYYRNIICLTLREFLKENGFKFVDEYGISHEDFASVKKQDIETAEGKFTEATTEGLTFLEKNGKRFVLSMNEGYRQTDWDLSVSYNRNDHADIKSFLTDLEKFAKDRCYLRGAKIDPSLSFIKLNKKYTWDDIILPKYIKDELKLNTEKLVDSIDFYKKQNLPFKRGIILEGVPGTGKTLIGRVLCSTMNCSFLWVTPKFLQDSRAIAMICELARQLAPCVLFLEDLDLYASEREGNRDSNLLGELMNQLDGLVENNYVIVIATTNKVDFIEEALRNRPGRFDRTITIPKPKKGGRKRLLKLCLDKLNTYGDFLEEVAEQTDGFTGSHIQELVNTAVMVAIENKSLDKEGKLILRKEYLIDNIGKVKNKKLEPSMGFDTNKKDNPVAPADWDDIYE